MDLEQPEKAIEYVLVFLPGFLALGLMMYVTDFELSEFAYIYAAIALSLAIYALVRGIVSIVRRCKGANTALRAGSPGRIVVVLFVAIISGLLLVVVHETAWVVGIIHTLAPRTVLKSSHRSPLVGLIHADANRTLHEEYDKRAVDYRLTKGARGSAPVIAPYNLYIRVYISDDRIYEGRPIRFNTGKEKNGFPLILSPACRVEITDNKVEKFGRLFGPGVLISGEDLQSMELYEAAASGCSRCFKLTGADTPENCTNIMPVGLGKP